MIPIFVKLLTLILAIGSLSLAQESLPDPPVYAAEAEDAPSAPGFSVDPNVLFLQPLEVLGYPIYPARYMQCNVVLPDDSEELGLSEARYTLNDISESNDFILRFYQCKHQQPLPRRVFRQNYVFAVFENSNVRQSVLLYAYSTDQSSSIFEGEPHVGRSETTILSTDWVVIGTDLIRFSQTVHLKAGATRVEDNTQITNNRFFKRYLHLIRLADTGLVRIIYSLPLADYEWSIDDSEPTLDNQLDYRFIDSNSISVVALRESLTPAQEAWLGIKVWNQEIEN